MKYNKQMLWGRASLLLYFFENYIKVYSMSINYFAFPDEELRIPIRKKKRVRFHHKINYFVFKKEHRPSSLWWQEIDYHLANRSLELEVRSFMEVYNDNQLNLKLRPITRRQAYIILFEKDILLQ